MLKTIIFMGICLSFADAAFAALGENEAQIEKRYGLAAQRPQFLEKYSFRVYLKYPYLIEIFFNGSGLVEMEKVQKARVPSVNNGTPVAQEFNDQEIREFLDASSSYDGPFIEQPIGSKNGRVWFSADHKSGRSFVFRRSSV
jgi:hypothetical protein